MKKLPRLMRLLIPALVAIPLLGAAGLAAGTASASCATSPIAGSWRNVDAATRSITRVVITQTCDDVRHCDVDTGVCTGGAGAAFDISTFGKCSPTDCAWGSRDLADAGGGWYRTTYNFGFKSSAVWVKTYPFYGRTYLRVWVNNDFTPADGRTDYVTDEWFLP
jgi:hypothetical protein